MPVGQDSAPGRGTRTVVGSRWATGRIEAFSDGVFAIAITLLVLEIAVPRSELGHGIGGEWPSYLAYATSFVTIGGLWMVHHGLFRRLQYANSALMRINLALLMAVSFLPFPTTLLAEAITDSEAERAAVVFYGATLLVISLLVSGLWGVAARNRELLRPEVTDQEVNAILVATTPSAGFYIGVIVLAIFAPQVAAFSYLVIGILIVLRAQGDERGTPDAAGSA